MPSPKRLTMPPKLRCRLSLPDCTSVRVVLPPKVTPNAGVKCHSARAARGASRRQRQHTANVLDMAAARALGRELQEERREQRLGHVALGEAERRAQAVAVRQQDEGHLAQR